MRAGDGDGGDARLQRRALQLDGVVDDAVIDRVDDAVEIEIPVRVPVGAGELDPLIDGAVVNRVDVSVQVGVATAEQVLFIGATDTGVFAGQTVTGASTIAMYTYAGDLDFNGYVDVADYGVIDNWIQVPGTSGYANGDFNYDGVIDAADYGIIDNSIQLQGAPIPLLTVSMGASSAAMSGDLAMASTSGSAATLSGVTAVPEPSACGLAIVAAAGLLGRRRRRAPRD